MTQYKLNLIIRIGMILEKDQIYFVWEEYCESSKYIADAEEESESQKLVKATEVNEIR